MPRNSQQGSDTADRPSSTTAEPPPASPRRSSDFLIVGIGASAGGLDACRAFLATLPATSGTAFILVQHLDPTHESMMVDLLSHGAAITLRQATNGMLIEPDHMYVIPPGAYLSVGDGALHLSLPPVRHGARLPFDFLLHSLAEAYGARAVCVVLSGTGTDGSLGLIAIKEDHGLVIAQDPEEAGYDGMPRSAIRTGAVDLILPANKIPAAIASYGNRMPADRVKDEASSGDRVQDHLSEILNLLRSRITHDFTLYKPGTLQRRIERRMAMAPIKTANIHRYLEILRNDAHELDLLAKDFLINVTSFFRDTKVFEYLKDKIVPELVQRQDLDMPLRIWIAGCSTGEETYSLAMLFQEEIAASKPDIKLQIFASDFDPDAIAVAREGSYPKTIEAEVSPARLARFFYRDDHGYQILPELRSLIVFTVQNVLADPPFARLDMVSCRNLLIYLRPEAQAKVISLFHFALREGGILLLGNAETAGNVNGRFEVVSKQERLYRHVGRSRLGDISLQIGVGAGLSIPRRPGQAMAPSRQASLVDLCQRLVIENYAPAAVLINRKHECLYSLGPTDRYLRIPAGSPSYDLFALVRQGLRTKLRAAIQRAVQGNMRVVVPGGQLTDDEKTISFSIAAQPVLHAGEELLLICFVNDPPADAKRDEIAGSPELSRVAELEQELEATRAELNGAIRNLEISNEEQKAINEEALSVNEEYQSTNEELLTSKEELQSLNEELTALNNQLQETLEQQRTTFNDLQNVLYSTNVATIFLDRNLRIRFFTPATQSLFNVIPSDIGRPLADFSSLVVDNALLPDARAVMLTLAPVERQVDAKDNISYMRRILPYRTQVGTVDGVVVTFADITEQKRIATALETAKRQAEMATVAKSRFLAAASHDLRQPLQTLVLLQGSLANTARAPKEQGLLARMDETLNAMSGMLNTLLDINQIEAGVVRTEMSGFPINELLIHLRDEFAYLADPSQHDLRVVPCGLSIYSDPRLLEQMVRNLLSNALKYTPRGKLLLGCRRHGEVLRIEMWDTGIGIAEAELDAIFEEYHQIDNAARDRDRGLGLGLAIVKRLADLLNHRISVRSILGKGSVFTIDVPIAPKDMTVQLGRSQASNEPVTVGSVNLTGSILVIEDDPTVCELLTLLLRDEGHHVIAVLDGAGAFKLAAHGMAQPDLILTDYNLSPDLNGAQITAKLREHFDKEIPAIILTGDISTDTLQDISLQNCVKLDKPVKTEELRQVLQRLLPAAPRLIPQQRLRPVEPVPDASVPVIYIVDDDTHVRAALRNMLEDNGRVVEDYESCEMFLQGYCPGRVGCLLIDAYLVGMSGIDLLKRLHDDGYELPSIMITGNSDVAVAVEAMKAGAVDFIEKPVGALDLLASIDRALEQARDSGKLDIWRVAAAEQFAGLSLRQHQIMTLVLAGQLSKVIAADLGISQRTVEGHRAEIMKKTGCKSLPALARLALAARLNTP